jgi:hypothetical protein
MQRKETNWKRSLIWVFEVIQRYVCGGERASGWSSQTEGEKNTQTRWHWFRPLSFVFVGDVWISNKFERRTQLQVPIWMQDWLWSQNVSGIRDTVRSEVLWMYLATVCSRVCVVPATLSARVNLLVSGHCYVYADTMPWSVTKNSPITCLGWPIGFQEVKFPRFLNNGTEWWWGCQP